MTFELGWPQVTTAKITGNPFHCDCDLSWLIDKLACLQACMERDKEACCLSCSACFLADNLKYAGKYFCHSPSDDAMTSDPNQQSMKMAQCLQLPSTITQEDALIMVSLTEDIVGFVNLQTTLVVLVVLLMTYVYVTRPRNLPPGPWGWPIVGNLITLSKGNIHLTLSKWREKYGAIVFFKIGTLKTVCLNDYDVIKEAYVKRSDMFGNRPTNLRIVNQLINQKGIIFAPLGPHWWEQRQFAVASLGFGSRDIEDRVLEEAATMQAELLKTKRKLDITILL
ncbi:CYP2J2 [Branchiostoma lanceolatum]|uniref:CYP2J2 protein n=1 Tax=Branchiostoma lanceolatum TaxID=7740 RepID=A0A8J9YZ98_BRALA|nr:CYP2J2 [Branchiostoma lanceolatum]